MRNILEVKDFSAGYGKQEVVKGLCFTLEEGTLTGLLGANGSGKTTLIKALCGLISSEGDCRIKGTDPRSVKPRKRAGMIGYIPQGGGISFSIPVMDVVLMGFNPVLGVLEQPGPAHRRRALEALAQVGLQERAEADFLTLSGGQQQLVILACAMVQDTSLLLFDEPNSALDFNNHHETMSRIRKMTRREGVAGLICLHDINFALQYCDRLLFLKEGGLVDYVNPGGDSEERLLQALEAVYGKIELLMHRAQYILVKEDDERRESADVLAARVWDCFVRSGKRHLMITGNRGSGKSTLLEALLRDNPLPGLHTKAIRSGRSLRPVRVDLTTVPGEETCTIGIPGATGSMVPTEGFALGTEWLKNRLTEPEEWVVIDEIGYLESSVPEYLAAIQQVLQEKRLIAVLRKADLPHLDAIRRREDVCLIDLDQSDSF